MKRRVGVYGGSFDPLHRGHLAIAHGILEKFDLDEFIFIPAFHAPHKPGRKPTSPFHRYAMLTLASADNELIKVSRIELESPDQPYSVQTITRMLAEMPGTDIYFVIGADSWTEIKTWREWETVLTMTNIIVITRPGYDMSTEHVTSEISGRVFDLRAGQSDPTKFTEEARIYFSDIVSIDVSSTEIRRDIRSGDAKWRNEVPTEVAKYIEKYQIYR